LARAHASGEKRAIAALARTFACLAVALLTLFFDAATALALRSLTLTTTATPSFTANLNLGDQTPTYTAPLTVADTRTAPTAGWNLTITSTQLTTGTRTLASTASSITAVSFACISSCTTNPTNAISYPVALPAATTPPTAVKLYNAAANTGKGTFTITPTATVSVPSNSYGGSYSSTLTLSVVSGP
jgi:hypothetical protein